MALADIDAAATQRRIQEAVEASRKTFADLVQRSTEIDNRFREAVAKEEADLKAALERKADAEAAAARKAAEREKEQQPEEPKPRPKPATLALGADEFKEARQARKAADEVKPVDAAKPVPPPVPAAEPPRPGKTLKLGARDDEEPRRTMKLGARDDEPAPEERPARRPRPPRPEGDDDMSGRTWLR
ncbi:hypothetical protein [Actinophytocola sp. KF-1]